MTTELLAKKVIETLAAQQKYSRAAKAGVISAERNKLLEESNQLEKELRQMAQDVLKVDNQISLF